MVNEGILLVNKGTYSIHGNHRAGEGNKHNNDQSANQAAAGRLVGVEDS